MKDGVAQYESNIKENVRLLKHAVALQDWKEVVNVADGIKEDAEEIVNSLTEEVITVPKDMLPEGVKQLQREELEGRMSALASETKLPGVPAPKPSKEKLEATIKKHKREATDLGKELKDSIGCAEWENAESTATTLLEVLKDMSTAMDELQELEDAEEKFDFRKLFALPSAQLCFWHDSKTGAFAFNAGLHGKPEEPGIQRLTGDVTMAPESIRGSSASLRFWWRGTNEPASQPASKFIMLNLKEGLEVLCRFGWFVRERSRDPKEISIEEYGLVYAMNEGPHRVEMHSRIYSSADNSWMASTDKSLDREN